MTGNGLNDNALDLTSDCLVNPNRLHTAILEAVMLWPHDPAARERAIHTSTVEFIKLNREAFSEDIGVDLFEFAAAAQPISNVVQDAKEPYVHGIISGFILWETVGKCMLKVEGASIGNSIETAKKKFYPQWRVSVKHINNVVWPRYKAVSHFWAAYWLRFKEAKTAPPPFPCDCLDMGDFLATADELRTLAETVRTFKAPAPILASNLAVRVPFDVQKVAINFTTVNGS